MASGFMQRFKGKINAAVIYLSGQFYVSATDGMTAHAGGGQANAVPLPTLFNRVTTVGSANDSVLLPPAIAGIEVLVVNAAAANSMNVFPSTGDAINALAANAAFAVAANKTCTFFCVKTGVWHSQLTA